MIDLEAYREWIDSALVYSGGTHTFEDVARGIAEGRMQIWPAPRGVAVTELIVYPRKKVLHVFLAAGEMDQLLDMIDAACSWGRSQGATSLTMSGRRGWERVLQRNGWTPVMSVMEKAI